MTDLRAALQNLTDEEGLVGAEIGVWRGEYAKAILQNLDISVLYLIDPYDCFEGYGDFDQDELDSAEKEARERLDEYSQSVTWINEFSDEAWKDIKAPFLDFIYIDGCHKTPFVYADIAIYTQLVKYGGLVSGHDYRQDLDGRVADAVQLYCDTHEMDLHNDHADWWFWK